MFENGKEPCFEYKQKNDSEKKAIISSGLKPA